MAEFEANRRTIIGGAMLAAAMGTASAPARAQGAAQGLWRATSEAADSWMDRPNQRHRIALDCTNADAAAAGLSFANNYIHTAISGYGLTAAQLGVIVILRHQATPFAFNDAMWVKYGRKFASMLSLEGGRAIRAVSQNPLRNAPADASPPPADLPWLNKHYLDPLAALGVQFAVCGLATEGIADQLAGKGDFKPIYAELDANLIGGAHMMPSGIVAVGHVQEHGYPIAYVGPEPS